VKVEKLELLELGDFKAYKEALDQGDQLVIQDHQDLRVLQEEMAQKVLWVLEKKESKDKRANQDLQEIIANQMETLVLIQELNQTPYQY